MKVVAIIQARMGSTRLPGKVLFDLVGEPILARVVNRVSRAETVDEVIVATTTQPADEAIAAFCHHLDWDCFRGSEDDVLDRYYRTAMAHQAEIIVRITSDCPLIEPKIIDRVVTAFLENQPFVDYACNVLPQRTFPRGLDTEVFSFNALAQAWREDSNPAWREHVTPYIYRNPDIFIIHGVMGERDYSQMRWTVDTPEDFELVHRIYKQFGHDHFTWTEVLTLLAKHPAWLEINRHIEQKAV